MIADQDSAAICPGIYSLCVPSDADRAARARRDVGEARHSGAASADRRRG